VGVQARERQGERPRLPFYLLRDLLEDEDVVWQVKVLADRDEFVLRLEDIRSGRRFSNRVHDDHLALRAMVRG